MRFDDLEAPVKAPSYARTSIYTLLRAALKIDIYRSDREETFKA